MQLPERIWILLARKLSTEASEEELNEFESLLTGTPELGPLIEIFQQVWDTPLNWDGRSEKLPGIFPAG